MFRIEGIPVIIRFKTVATILQFIIPLCIEGIPVIIRFKTNIIKDDPDLFLCIEGIPVIIRFKTSLETNYYCKHNKVLKVFQL